MVQRDPSIPVRRLSFDDQLQSLPTHFADGDLLSSHIVATLSALFPDGEDFFVRSVRRYRDQLDDPELQRQVSAFIGQESVHGREHRAFNRRLSALGYPTERIERRVRAVLERAEKDLTAEECLAVTAALEHFTACMGEILLRDDRLESFIGHEGVRQMFLWHGLEELEHKSVAFDVYRHVGCSEEVRIRTMRRVMRGFVVTVALQTAWAVLHDRATYRRGVLWRSIGRVRTAPLFSREMWAMLRDYLRADFHPTDSDTDELVARVRDELLDGESPRVRAALAA